MFESLRWRFTVWFVLLSAIAYSLLITLGAGLFYVALNAAIDDEISQLANEIVPTISYKGGRLGRSSWPAKLHTEPSRILASIQLYDRDGRLIFEQGRKGVTELAFEPKEMRTLENSVRSRSLRLMDGDSLVGYLQVQLPTDQRKNAVEHFLLVMAVIAPVLLITLAFLGYFFAGMTTRPVETSFTILQNFMSDAGHELQTPVSIIQSTAQNLERRAKDVSWLDKKLSIIRRSADRMDRLIGDLKVLSQIESGQIVRLSSVFRFDHVVSAVIEDMETLFEEKNLTLKADIDSPVSIDGDPEAIHRVVSNLLSNALRYTDAPGTVTVTLKQLGKNARLTVEDSGIGIPPTSLNNVFNRFYRVDRSRSRGSGGSGLGLAIVKAAVRAHAGRIEVMSEVGKGTRFVVNLPCKNA